MMEFMEIDGRRCLRDSIVVRRRNYFGDDMQQSREELETVLRKGPQMILIEPALVGNEIAKVISVANEVNKIAVVSGSAGIFSALMWPTMPFIYAPLSIVSIAAAGIYATQGSDPCACYQVDPNPLRLFTVYKYLGIQPSVILVRNPDTRRKIIHRTVALASVIFSAWNAYKYFKD